MEACRQNPRSNGEVGGVDPVSLLSCNLSGFRSGVKVVTD